MSKKVEEETPVEISPVKESISVEKPFPEKKEKPPKKRQKKQKKGETLTFLQEGMNAVPPSVPPETKEAPQKEETLPATSSSEKKGFFARLFKKPVETSVTEPSLSEKVPEKKGFFATVKEKILMQKISAEKFEELFFELEVTLLENNVAVAVIDKIKHDLQKKLVDQPIPRGTVLEVIRQALHQSLAEVLSLPSYDVFTRIREKRDKPYVIVFVGVNGSGKTTTIAKVAHSLKERGLKCLLVAGDTWRSAAIQQLEEHGKKLGIRVVKHDYGSDPAAVAFDGIKAAQATGVDVVLIDTAGRQQSNTNLMREMEKIIRVAHPDLKIFIGESITGNDCVTQAQEFDRSVHLDGVILTKADVDEKGGTALSISYVLGKPILYFGMGQSYTDLKPFQPSKLLKNLGL